MKSLQSSLLGVLLLAACTTGGEEKTVLPPLQPLRAGAGEALMGLPIGHSTAGYAQTSVLAFEFPKNEPGSPFADLFPATRGMQAPPKAKAVLLDNGQTKLAIVKIDAILTSDVLVRRATQLAAERLDLDLDGKLIISATHTHGAGCRFATSLRVKLLESQEGWRQDAIGHGVDAFNPESVDRVANAVVEAIGAAQADLRPAALGYARAPNTDGSRDRRCQDDAIYGEDNIDRDLRLIRIDEVGDDDKPVAPIALLANFAMHGTVYGANNHNLSGDAPGYVESKLEERFGAKVTAMFMQGTAGDVSPGGEGDGSQRMEDVGYRVADTAFRLYQAVTGAAEADKVVALSREVPIRVKSRRIPVTHDLLYEDGEFHEDGAILCMMAYNDNCPDGGGDVPVASSKRGSQCLGVGLPEQGKYHTDLLAAQIGPLMIATLPGEPVSEIGRLVKKAAAAEGFDEVLIYGYAQDHHGYLLMPDDWLRGGYEPTISFWGWNFMPYVLEQQADLMHELATGDAAKKKSTPRVPMPDMTYEPVAAAPGSKAPAVTLEPASLPRLNSLTVRWTGGDPVLGLPTVTVERKTASGFEPLLAQGWRTVDNRSYEIATDYQSAPSYQTYKEFKERNPNTSESWGSGKWIPDHQWQATWGVPAWVPAGEYRVHITGGTVKSSGAAPSVYDLTSAVFTISANGELRTNNGCDSDGNGSIDLTGEFLKVTTDATGINLSVAAFYPQFSPIWDYEFNGGEHQLGNFRLWSQRGTFRYPHTGAVQGSVTVKKDGTPVGTITLGWVDDGKTGKLAPFCPGSEGLPRAEGTFAWAGSGAYTLEFATGDITDAYGNAIPGRVVAVP